MNYLPKRGGRGDLRTMILNISCSKSNFITFYRSTGIRNQVETQKERSQGTPIHEILCNICWEGGSENNELQKIFSKSNSITSYRSPGMRNEVETQRNGPKGFQFMRILCNICWEGSSENNKLQNICSKSKSITFYRSPGMSNQVENKKGRVPRDFNSWEFYATFAERGAQTTLSCKTFAQNPILSRCIDRQGCATR